MGDSSKFLKTRSSKIKRPKQLVLLKAPPLAYGGDLLKTRKGRSGPRPISTRDSIHLVLRSSKAKGKWSFRAPQNQQKIAAIVQRFAIKHHIKILSFANVGNHLHLHIQLLQLHSYRKFIRAITSAIAMTITGVSRWKKSEQSTSPKFWDYRPFTRVVRSYKAVLNLKDYIEINRWEGFGASRKAARIFVKDEKWFVFESETSPYADLS